LTREPIYGSLSGLSKGEAPENGCGKVTGNGPGKGIKKRGNGNKDTILTKRTHLSIDNKGFNIL
jgi:hypothetical protein